MYQQQAHQISGQYLYFCCAMAEKRQVNVMTPFFEKQFWAFLIVFRQKQMTFLQSETITERERHAKK